MIRDALLRAAALAVASARWSGLDLRDLLLGGGLLLLSSGLGQVWGPLAQIAAGAVLVAFAWRLYFGRAA